VTWAFGARWPDTVSRVSRFLLHCHTVHTGTPRNGRKPSHKCTHDSRVSTATMHESLRPGSEAKRGESKGLMNDGREARESDDGLSEAEARDARK